MIDKTDCRLEQSSCWAFCVVSVSKLCSYPTQAELLSGDQRLPSANRRARIWNIYTRYPFVCPLPVQLANPEAEIFTTPFVPPCLGLGATNVISTFQTYWYFTSTCPHCVIYWGRNFTASMWRHSHIFCSFLLYQWLQYIYQTEMRLQYICLTVMENLKKETSGNQQEPHPWSDHLGTGENCKNIGNHGLRGVLSRMTGMPFVVTAGAYLLHTQSPIILTVDRANHPSGSCVVKWRERTRGANCFNRFLQATYGWSSLKFCLRRASRVWTACHILTLFVRLIDLKRWKINWNL